MTLLDNGRPRMSAKPAGGQKAENARIFLGHQNRRRPPPVTLTGMTTVTSDTPPADALPKPPRRYWRKWDR